MTIIATQPIQWFNRTVGKWRSERRYIFKENANPVNLTTMMEITFGEKSGDFVIDWNGQTTGKMEVSVYGDQLIRSRDYFGGGAHPSKIIMIDDDTICFTTSYDGVTYREEIRLLSNDCYRLRQTFGVKEDQKFALVGQYCEFRL